MKSSATHRGGAGGRFGRFARADDGLAMIIGMTPMALGLGEAASRTRARACRDRVDLATIPP